ncbi:hypothetical protein Mal15_69190 [Stieleria maiorica]|uniref:Uncharacterized protein n=1 Tax=Stieleria maiorica TaxID=2795974 RepID=A0A5B9MUS0_9BACT|nr:hypothetical protein [Stieleria maiorica]QEG02798.1 hypothetical protein Mal15_69190 [Stieleria maiorica]
MFACIFTAVLTPRWAEAGGNSPIYVAASDYRDAVKAFERVVLRTPKIRSSVERLVDDLEDSTSDLKSAARDPARLDRLLSRFVATDALHCRVELTFFGDPIFPAEPRLEESWIAVYEAYGRLVYEIRYLQQLRSAKRGRPIAIVDHRYAPPTAYEPAVVARSPADAYRSATTGSVPSFRSATAGSVPSFTGSVPGVAGVITGSVPGVTGSVPRVITGSVPGVTGSVPRVNRSATTGSVPGVSGPAALPRGARLQRPPGAPAPTRRIISTPEQLRSAILGAILQRQR